MAFIKIVAITLCLFGSGAPPSMSLRQLASMRAAVRDVCEPTNEITAATRPITMQELMRHTSGIIYGGRGTSVVHTMYPSGSSAAAQEYDATRFIDKLATL